MAVVALWLCGYAAQPQRHSHFGFAVAWIGYATAIALTRSRESSVGRFCGVFLRLSVFCMLAFVQFFLC